MALFLVAAELEAPRLSALGFFRQKFMAVSRQLPRPKQPQGGPLEKLVNLLRLHSDELGLKDVQYGWVVPHLNIAGIHFTYGRFVLSYLQTKN